MFKKENPKSVSAVIGSIAKRLPLADVSHAEQVRVAFDEITKIKSAGMSDLKIVAALNAEGINLSLANFRQILVRVRKERKKSCR